MYKKMYMKTVASKSKKDKVNNFSRSVSHWGEWDGITKLFHT